MSSSETRPGDSGQRWGKSVEAPNEESARSDLDKLDAQIHYMRSEIALLAQQGRPIPVTYVTGLNLFIWDAFFTAEYTKNGPELQKKIADGRREAASELRSLRQSMREKKANRA